MKTVSSVYTLLMNTIYLSNSSQVQVQLTGMLAEGTIFRKHTVFGQVVRVQLELGLCTRISQTLYVFVKLSMVFDYSSTRKLLKLLIICILSTFFGEPFESGGRKTLKTSRGRFSKVQLFCILEVLNILNMRLHLFNFCAFYCVFDLKNIKFIMHLFLHLK